MNNVDQFLARLKGFKPIIDSGEVPQKNVDACRTYLELPHFNKVGDGAVGGPVLGRAGLGRAGPEQWPSERCHYNVAAR